MSLVAVVGGASFGFGLLCALDTFRVMSMNGIFDSWESPIADQWPIFLLPGIFGGVLVGAIGRKAAAAYGGRLGATLLVIPFTLIGVLAVATAAPQLMTPPSQLGTKLDPAFNHPEPWQLDAWVAYWAPFAAPGVVGVALLVVLVVRVRSMRKAAFAARLVEQGRRVEGTVTEVGGGSTEVNGQLLITFTVRFVDHHGTTRFVTKRKPVPLAQLPSVGQRAVVFFEPEHVGDEGRIAVGFGSDTDLDDALSLHAAAGPAR